MAGTYRKLKSGKWELCCQIGYDLAGKRIRKYKYVEAKGVREVEKLLAEFVVKCSNANYSDGGNITLKNYSELWMKDYAKEHLRKRTSVRYGELMERINQYLGHFKLADLKPTHLVQFYKILQQDGIRKDNKPGGLSPKTIRHYHGVISIMLQTAVDWELINGNVALKVKPPKVVKKEKEVLTVPKLKELIKALNTEELKYRCIVLIAIFTGFRRSEIIGLEWSDINFEDKYIYVNKTVNYTVEDGIYEDETKTVKSNRYSYIPEHLIVLLKEYKKEWEDTREKLKDRWIETDKIFVQWNGAQMHPDSISQWFPKFIRKHKLDYITLHGLRHEHGSILLSMGMDPMAVSDQLGHSSMQMLISTYGHNVSKRNKDVVEFMNKALFENDEE